MRREVTLQLRLLQQNVPLLFTTFEASGTVAAENSDHPVNRITPFFHEILASASSLLRYNKLVCKMEEEYEYDVEYVLNIF